MENSDSIKIDKISFLFILQEKEKIQKKLIEKNNENLDKIRNLEKKHQNINDILISSESKVLFKEKIIKNLENQINTLKKNLVLKNEDFWNKNFEKQMNMKNKEIKSMIENLVYLENKENELENEIIKLKILLQQKNKEN